ncbi:MAG: peptide-methionine (S)-S-oxide reductase MsrA [Candidatus Competibacterales bacterium]
MTSLFHRLFLGGVAGLLVWVGVGSLNWQDTSQAAEPEAAEASNPDGLATAIFAGGCFWCMEPPYDKLDGVASTTSGYIGGQVENPTYQQVVAGNTGHAEAVLVRYDPAVVSYEKLLEVFWRNIDPLAVDRQFCDRGNQYRSAIFPLGSEQRRLAEASKRALVDSERFDQPIATTIETATTFYPAEDYHQDYYQKNPLRYKFYRYACGRDQRLEELWGDAS